MRKAWNRVQIIVIAICLLNLMVLEVAVKLPWRIGKGFIASSMDWAGYDIPSFGSTFSKIFKAIKLGEAPNYKRVKK